MTDERIIFEGERLPKAAWSIDILAHNEIIDDIEEELSLWFWHFRICAGCVVKEESKTVLKYSEELHSKLINNFDSIKQAYIKYSIERDSKPSLTEIDNTLQEWKTTLEVLIQTSKVKDECSWEGED